MPICLLKVYRVCMSLLVAACMLLNATSSSAQTLCDPSKVPYLVHPSKHEWVTSLDIGGGWITGLLAYLPPDYNTSGNKTYPLIIFFHGSGVLLHSNPGLCPIFEDQPEALVNKIEKNQFPTSVSVNGNTYSYIVISPRYTSYGEPGYYSDKVNELINHLIANYRVDTTRIYLTGLSAGANIVLDYISSSMENARRISAASMASPCFETWRQPNGPQIIANAGVPTWFLHCVTEGAPCNAAVGWVNEINASSPLTPPRYSFMTPNSMHLGYPQSLPYCQGWEHDTWTALYDQNFVPLDGAPNFYEWQLAFTATLPVTLKSFTARLSNGKVYLRGVTTSEKDNSAFVVERAGGEKPFTAIATIPGSGTSGEDVVYEYVDDQPLPNLSYYRLKQVDIDGRAHYFDTRKVMNRLTNKRLAIITPNPFTAGPAIFINTDKKQRLSIYITDMSGRVLSTVSGTYEAGTTELSLSTGNLPRGVYLLRVAGEGITETQKIIKQ